MVQKTDLVQLRGGFRPVQAGAQLSNPLAQRFGVYTRLLLLAVNRPDQTGISAKASGLPCGKDNEDDQDKRIRDVDRPIGRKGLVERFRSKSGFKQHRSA